jgi:hypothetical protein
VFDCEGEKHEIHGLIRSVVVVEEGFLNCPLKTGGINDFLIDFLGPKWRHAVSPQ